MENWSGHYIPLPTSFVRPCLMKGFQPTHLVILAGQEVGIFTSWYVLFTICTSGPDLINRLSHTSNHPPFSSGFFKWDDAVDYYAINYHANNVKIITAPGSSYDPITIASNAPTPVKKTKVAQGVQPKTIRRGAQDVGAKAGPSKNPKGLVTQAGLSTARTVIGPPRKRTRFDASSPTPKKKEGKKPDYANMLVDVSDYDSDPEILPTSILRK